MSRGLSDGVKPGVAWPIPRSSFHQPVRSYWIPISQLLGKDIEMAAVWLLGDSIRFSMENKAARCIPFSEKIIEITETAYYCCYCYSH